MLTALRGRRINRIGVRSTLVALSLMLGATAIQADFTPQYLPTINVRPATGTFKIDGELNDPGWQKAARADGFAEISPADQEKPPVESAAWITYDETHLYVALIAWDDPASVRVSMSDRDNIFSDDYFGIMLDTYGDASSGYEIFVNPLGIQGDLKMMSNGDEDMSFDMVFESVGKVTDSGYQVELAIPFASLRFPSEKEQVWRVNFWRDHQRDLRRRYAWAAQDRAESCFMCQWGYLTGIRDIKPGSNLDILPNIVAVQSGSRNQVNDSTSSFDNNKPDAQVSLNARYGLTSNSSVELTINPDFSQIESDAGQINVNTNFGLFFSERRPFFQEGSDLFRTRINAIYTRTINEPKVAGKYTGRFGRTSVAYLVAADESAVMMLPFAEQSIGLMTEKAIVNLARVKHSFGDNSFIGALVTDRRLDDFGYTFMKPGDSVTTAGTGTGGSGTTYGIDGRFRFSQTYRLDFQVLGSSTEEPNAPGMIDTTVSDGYAQQFFDRGRHSVDFDGETFSGHAINAAFIRSTETMSNYLMYWEFSPTFRADNGFQTQNDHRLVLLGSELDFRPNGNWLVEWSPEIEIGRKWDHAGFIDINPTSFNGGSKDEWIRPSVQFSLKGQTNISMSYLNSRERYGDKLFEGISRVTFDVDSRFSEILGGGVNVTHGRGIYRNRLNPEMGRQTDLSVYLSIKLGERLKLNPDFIFARMDHLDPYLEANPDEGKEIYSGYILRNRMTYQFTREWFLRLIVQYNDFSQQVDFEPLLTYKLNPFTKLYVGMSWDFNDNESDGTPRGYDLSQRQVFAKFQYLFRM